MQTPISSLSLHPRSERNDDSVAQPVEHNTFNVGVLGSNPSWITKTSKKILLKFNEFRELEKPRDFDPFGHAGFAHLWLQYD